MTTGDAVNKSATVAAISSPWWLPVLHKVSDGAALVLPILGVLWLLIQMFWWIYSRIKGKAV
ncbi:hypothetical protein AYJ54_00795 [Bradyrhizobium centrolobii]|uniref:Uncharacterized protein n=1 Tax=Bradyrhizobium centrolobii TaxID=1505087 RepID=A0A176YII4_9BRAD|nr:hypothetical protein AYJ54_00795 [Bradyrhizobium centrolobii]